MTQTEDTTDGGRADEAVGSSRELRSGADRRRHAIPRLQYLLAGGRRSTVRRGEDHRRIVILDWYHPKLLAAIIGILGLSLLDALLTLYLVENGSSEVNPVMNYFLEKGPLVFVVAKYILTSMAVVIFLLVANSVIPRSNFPARKLFRYALIAFGSVVMWEIALVLVLAWRV